MKNGNGEEVVYVGYTKSIVIGAGIYCHDYEKETKIYKKLGLALNNTPKSLRVKSKIIEYKLVPTGREFDTDGNLLNDQKT